MAHIKKLHTKKDFQDVTNSGIRKESDGFIIYFLERGNGNKKIGISAKGNFQRNVDRNKAKRWAREFIRKKEPLIPDSSMIVIVKPELLLESFAERIKEFEIILNSFKEK